MRLRSIALSAAVVCALALVVACSHDSSSEKKTVFATMGLSVQQAGDELFSLTADPQHITIDTTNPDTPKDPGTGKFIGTSVIRATLKDAEGAVRPGVAVLFTTDSGTLASAGAPVTTNDQGVAEDTLTVTEDAPATVNVKATAEERSVTIPITVTVVLPNRPPVADAGPDRTVECASPNGTPVRLNGSGSSDPDSTPGTNDDIVKYEWLVNGVVVATGQTASVTLPTGTTVVTLQVTDKAGATATDEVVIQVVDTTPPVLRVTPRPSMLWPPNHTMRDIEVGIDMVDACTPPGMITVMLESVSSNEPDNGLGDGDTTGDIAGASVGTDDRSLSLRAERAGGGNGRVYTLVYSATDAAGLVTQARGRVVVPHDQGH